MADVISENIIKELRNIVCEDNPLFAYDNYTYNIELCMIPKIKLKDYATMKLNYFNNPYGNNPQDIADFILNKSDKMTIVNTTTTTQMFIDSLTTTTYLGLINNSRIQSLNQEFNMKIIENNGCSLTSKLKLAAAYYGYEEGYIAMPLFLIIHFTGYDSNTLESVNEIDVVGSNNELSSNRNLVQEVRITDVVTHIDKTNTSYDVKMAANYNMGMALDILTLNGMESIELDSGTTANKALDIIKNKIMEFKKDKIKESYFSDADYKSIYGDESPIQINITGDIPDFQISSQTNVPSNKVVEEEKNEANDAIKIKEENKNGDSSSYRETQEIALEMTKKLIN